MAVERSGGSGSRVLQLMDEKPRPDSDVLPEEEMKMKKAESSTIEPDRVKREKKANNFSHPSYSELSPYKDKTSS